MNARPVVLVIVAALLSVLTSASAAAAACAWVLWEELLSVGSEGAPTREWGIVATAQAPEDCGRTATAAVNDRAARWNKPGPRGSTLSVKSEGNQVTVTGGPVALNYRYLCLPETIDPRGPKGGAR
jgi:hypothetical protein